MIVPASRLRRKAAAAAAVLLGSLPLPAGAAPVPKEREYRGKRVTLEEEPAGQIPACRPVHALGETVRIGIASFAVEREGTRVRVDRKGDGRGFEEIRPGKTLEFPLGEGGDRREVGLRFLRDGDGPWRYHAAAGWKYVLGGEEILLLDADADGRHDRFGTDAMALHGSGLAIPLAREFPLGRNLVRIASVEPDGSRITAAVEPLAGSDAQVLTLEAVNRLRAAHGLLPVTLDPALSKGCTAHALYLARNSWTGRTNPHTQNLGPEGKSEEGERAARRSVIAGGSPASSIPGYWMTYYHRIGLMGPALETIGVNAEPANLSVVDVAGAFEWLAAAPAGDAPPWPWEEPVTVPAHGSRGVPVRAMGESPSEPVPSLATRGFPLIAIFREHRDVKDFGGTLEELRGGRGSPVPVLVADQGHYPFAFGLVPEGPLRGNTAYRATLNWKRGGEAFRKVVEFRTD